MKDLWSLLCVISFQTYDSLFEDIDCQSIFACTVYNLKPKSRGSVTLNSDDPCDDPIIDPNYLDEKDDEKNFVDGKHLYFF